MIAHLSAGARPSEAHPIAEMLFADPVQQGPHRLLLNRRDAPPGVAHRQQPFSFRVAQPQPLGKSLSIFDDANRQCAEAAAGIGRKASRSLDRRRAANSRLAARRRAPVPRIPASIIASQVGATAGAISNFISSITDTFAREGFNLRARPDTGSQTARIQRALT